MDVQKVLHMNGGEGKTSYAKYSMLQVPQGLEDRAGIPLNKGNIYLAKSSLAIVQEAFLTQFIKDFSSFLSLRSVELILGGCMLLTFMGRRNDDPLINENCTPWKLLSSSLIDMILEGIVEESKLDSFNLPYCSASVNEIRSVIEGEAPFNLHRLETFEINWDGAMEECDEDFMFDKLQIGENITECIRAVTESMLVSQFGVRIMEDIFHRFMVKVTDVLKKEEPKYANVVISLTKKN